MWTETEGGVGWEETAGNEKEAEWVVPEDGSSGCQEEPVVSTDEPSASWTRSS